MCKLLFSNAFSSHYTRFSILLDVLVLEYKPQLSRRRPPQRQHTKLQTLLDENDFAVNDNEYLYIGIHTSIKYLL